MPQINLAKEFDKRVQERLHMTMATEEVVNHNYKFDGEDTLVLTSVDNMPMGDYSKSGTSRYGTPLDISDYTQVVQLDKDRAFTGIIDKGDVQDQKIQKTASDALRRQTDEVLNFEIEKHRIQKMVDKTGIIVPDNSLSTAGNALTDIYKMNENATNHYAPKQGRCLLATPYFIHLLLADKGGYIKYSDRSQEMLIKGIVGEVDGIKVIEVSENLMPTNVVAVMAHKDATTAVEKLKDFTIHENPPGINGNLIEGRIRYGAFVLDTKVPLLGYVYKGAATAFAADVEPSVTETGGTKVVIAAGSSATNAFTADYDLLYTTDGSDPRTNGTKVDTTGTGSPAVYTFEISESGWVNSANQYSRSGGCKLKYCIVDKATSSPKLPTAVYEADLAYAPAFKRVSGK